MRVPFWSIIRPVLFKRMMNIIGSRREDERIPPEKEKSPYLWRWYLYRNKKRFNLYLHIILRSDDDRAFHCHPWKNASLILEGSYREYTPGGCALRRPGDLVFRRADAQHRLELIDNQPVMSLFFTGPKIREWGFYCPQGFVHHKDYDPAGCGE